MPQNQNAAQTSNHLRFDKLPKAIQQRLLERQLGQREGFAFQTGGILRSVVIVPIVVVWIGIVFYLTDDDLWSNAQTIILMIISLIVLYLLLHHLFQLTRWLTSHSKNYLLITRHYIIDISFNDVWYWSLNQLIAPNGIHRYKDGRYISTEVTLTLEGGVTKTFSLKNLGNADDTIEEIFHYKKLFAEARAKNDIAYLNEHNDFIQLESQSSQPQLGSVPSKKLRSLLTAVFSIVLTAGLIICAASLNNYYDDKKSWKAAQSINQASALRRYLQTHPQGRWTSDARQKLQGLYEIAEQKYLSSLNKGYDQKAANAVLQVLDYAKRTQNYRTQIVFERHNEIPQNIVAELTKEFEVKNILSLGDTFSDAKMSGRESGLFAVVADAFRQVIPDDILEFSTVCSDECVVFAVKYKIGAKDSLYFDVRQENLPDAERTFYPGIFINWDFNIKAPNQPQNYDFELASSPAAEIKYDTNSAEEGSDKDDFAKVLDADKNYIYDSMVASAFDDFKTNLVYRMGIGAESPKGNESAVQTETAPVVKKDKRKQRLPQK